MEKAGKGTLGRGNSVNKDTGVSECLVGISRGRCTVCLILVSQCLASQLAQGRGSPRQKPCPFPLGTPRPPLSNIRLLLHSALPQCPGLKIHCQQSQEGNESEHCQTSMRHCRMVETGANQRMAPRGKVGSELLGPPNFQEK